MKHPPIAVMSFDRPGYLREVLVSLAAQKDAHIEEREIFLFQDGWRNEFSGRVAADEHDIAACVLVFRGIFPRGHVVVSPSNLGVAGNFLRAETTFFREMKADCAYFFEDDLVLAPHYLSSMDALRDAAAPSDRVGYFACYGSLRASAEAQLARARTLRRIDHFWGFGLFRSHWEDMQPLMKDYYDMVLGMDYKVRPHERIRQVYHRNDILVGATSQDDVKKAVTYKLGRVGLNTVMVNARYIGAVGLHMSAKRFNERGFGRTVMLDHDRVDFDFPSLPQLDEMVQEELVMRRRRVAAGAALPPKAGRVSAGKASGGAQPGNVTLGLPRMSEPERELLNRMLASGRKRYAEFGIGGSTLLALRQGFDALVGVESDGVWANAVREHEEIGPAIASGTATILHADIGPVGSWGTPIDETYQHRWPSYISTMWAEWARRKSMPDLVLVDGRFRVACALSVAVVHAMHGHRTEPPLVMLHDVSSRRPNYLKVLDAFELEEQAGELVVMRPRSDVEPGALFALMMSRLFEVS